MISLELNLLCDGPDCRGAMVASIPSDNFNELLATAIEEAQANQWQTDIHEGKLRCLCPNCSEAPKPVDPVRAT